MRAGVLVLGPLLSKYKKAKISLPGGCAIGTRPVDLHLYALKKLGAKIKIKNGYIIAEAEKGLKGANINFPSISVGATENALLAAFNADPKTLQGHYLTAKIPLDYNSTDLDEVIVDLIKSINYTLRRNPAHHISALLATLHTRRAFYRTYFCQGFLIHHEATELCLEM